MKRALCFLFLLIGAAPLMAELPTYAGWPKCVPVLGFSDSEIGVASFQTIATPKPVQRWVCMTIDRATFLVTPVEEAEFDARFPGVRQAGNHASGDCQEMVRPSKALPDSAEPPTCIDTKVLCGGRVVPVKVSAAVTAARCPGRLFSAATMIDGKLWAGVNPMDIYFRELDGSDLLVQSLTNSAVLARRSSEAVGGRSVCAIRRDYVTGHVWITTETGLSELTADGTVIRSLRFVATRRPMRVIQKP